MKKIFFVLTVLLVVAGVSVVNAATVVVENIDIDGIYGFGSDIIVSPPDSFDADAFNITELEAMPSDSMWVSWIVTNPKPGVSSIDFSAAAKPLLIGNFLQIGSIYEFELTNFLITDKIGNLLNFKVNLDDNTYKLSNVPIPGAIWFLGSGLLGLIGIGRKRMKKA